MCVVCVVFFFKQKTAYEMRISDWSSDVCSSDLIAAKQLHEPAHLFQRRFRQPFPRFLLDQFLGHAGETMAGADARLDARLTLGGVGIDSMGNLLARRIAC